MRWFKLVALEERARERSERERRESGVLELSSYTKQNSIITPANIYTQPSTTFVTVIADTIQTNILTTGDYATDQRLGKGYWLLLGNMAGILTSIPRWR